MNNNPNPTVGRSGGRSNPIQLNGPPQNPTPIGRSGGIKLPPVEKTTPNQNPNPNPLGRSGGIKLPPVEKTTPNQNVNPTPFGRSGGRSNPMNDSPQQNPIPQNVGRSGGRSNPITPNNTLGRSQDNLTLNNNNNNNNNKNNNPPPNNFPSNIPPPISFPSNIPPPINQPPQKENPMPQNPPPMKQPQKVVLPSLNMPVKNEPIKETKNVNVSSIVNPTLLVNVSSTTGGKSLGPISSEGVKEVSQQKGKTTGKGPRQPIIKPPLYKQPKQWSMPFKVPEIEANTDYIQPTAPLEQLPKVSREPQRKIKGDAWTKVKGPLMSYTKVKKNLMLETSNKKEKRYMAIYFNWILFWGSTGNKPEESDDVPVNYFDLDNVLDSTEIKINEKKNELTLPLLPNMGAKNIKFGFDETEDLRNWWKETKKIVAVLERTERSDMVNEDMVKLKLAEINLVFPEKNFVPNGLKGVVEWQKAGEWFAEMKNLYTQQRLISRYLRRVRLFQQYAIGAIGSYINWFFGSDGPHITLGKVEEVVFGNWINIINDIEKLTKELLVENAIDEDHLPFHMEDCQIAVHIIDLMNWYPTYVHNVKRDPQLLDRAQQFKQYFSQLSLKPVCQ